MTAAVPAPGRGTGHKSDPETGMAGEAGHCRWKTERLGNRRWEEQVSGLHRTSLRGHQLEPQNARQGWLESRSDS